MPCQNAIESTPATLNTKENARKYHFLPRKSMFGLRKNSTLYPKKISFKVSSFKVSNLTTQCSAPRHALCGSECSRRSRAKRNRGEQVCQQTEGQSDGKAFDRTGSEDKQDEG